MSSSSNLQACPTQQSNSREHMHELGGPLIILSHLNLARKEFALVNIPSMLVSLDVTKNVTSRSKALAPSNMRSMVSTLVALQNVKGLLNEAALRNSLSIKTTFEVSHREISPLNSTLFSNALPMFVTKLVSQFDMMSKFVVDFP